MDFDTISNSLKRFFKDPGNRALVVSLGSVFLTVILLFILFTIVTGKRDIEKEKAQALTDIEKTEIISEVIRNNSKSVVTDNPILKAPAVAAPTEESPEESQEEVSTRPLKTGYVIIDPATGQPVANPDATQGIGYAENPYAISTSEYPDLNKYNYRKTTVETTPGPKKLECDMFSYMLNESETRINYEYFDLNQYTYATERKTSQGNTFSKFISKYGKNINESFSNAFGEYAVVSKYKVSDYFTGTESKDIQNIASYTSYPLSYTLNSQIIGNYYSNPVEFLRVRTIEGKEYYEVKSQTYLDCNAIYGCGGPGFVDRQSPNYINLISISLIDAQSFEVVESSKYLNEVSEENRIYTEKTKTERSLTGFAQVGSDFNYTENTDIRVIDFASYQFDPMEYANRVNNYLSENQISILKPVHYSISNISGKNVPVRPIGSDFNRDRAYYSNDSIGESAYQKSQEAFGDHNPLIYSDFANYRLSIRQYESTLEQEELVEHMTEFSSGHVLYSSSVKVDGVEYPAQIIEYRTQANSVSSYPVSFPSSYAMSTNPTQYISYPGSYPSSYSTGNEIYNYGQNVNMYLSYAIVFTMNGSVYQVYSTPSEIGSIINSGFEFLKFGEEEYNSFQNSILSQYSTYYY